MENKLIEIFTNIGIMVDNINEELEIDSFQFINIIVEIENEFLVRIKEEDLVNQKYNSVAKFCLLVQKYNALLEEE